MKTLVVRGGRVLTPHGWRDADVIVEGARFCSGAAVVHVGGETVDGPDGRPNAHTGGAGAARVAVATTVEGEAAAAAREDTLAAAGRLSGAQGAGAAAGPSGAGAGESGTARVLRAGGCAVVPGFVDLQCNGGFGIDLSSEPERLWELAALLPRSGVTAWLPTIVTCPPEVRARALAALRAGPPPALADVPLATPLGLHFEGPFLAPERRGAHDPAWLRPPPLAPEGALAAEVAGWVPEAGVVLVTLAPELPGALDLVRALAERGVVVSAGHSSATAAQAEAAIDAGVRYVTHLFNAMAALHHREPALAGVALADDRVTVGLIADGVHVDARAVRLAARALGPRLSLVTDAVAAQGLTDRQDARPEPASGGTLGARTVAVGEGGDVRLPDGTLAGSTLTLDRAVRNTRAMAGLDLAAAVGAVTAVPAGLLGLADRGAILDGGRGDLVVLDDAGEVVVTVVGGWVAYARSEAVVPAHAE